LPSAIASTHRSFRWRPRRQLPPQSRPPRMLCSWLDDSGSLTARLIALSGGQFHVAILRQYLALPSREEQQALAMPRPARALIREVILYGRNQPWVFARSVLPLSSLSGKLRHLRKQRNRPLGAFLFSQPHLVRSPIAVAAFSTDDGYVPASIARQNSLWGRRSVFALDGKPLLVSEVFLPALCAQLLQDQPSINNQ
jgi:chorismate--pyruvate lyase